MVRQAQKLLESEGLLQFPISLIDLAATRGICVKALPGEQAGVSGLLLRHGNTFGILYGTHIPNEGFQRFCIAHELGHYFVAGHLDHITFHDGVHYSNAGFVADDSYEREADNFAAGLLLPTRLVQRELRTCREGLASVLKLSKRAKASFSASAIRYARVTDDPVAVIASEHGSVKFCFASDALKGLKGSAWLKPGTEVPENSETLGVAALNEQERVGYKTEGFGRLSDWFPDLPPLSLREEVVGLGHDNRVMTILTCEEWDDPREEDEELERNWRPSF